MAANTFKVLREKLRGQRAKLFNVLSIARMFERLDAPKTID